MKPRIGKCTNYSGCKLAYRNERINVITKNFVCPECGSPLEKISHKPGSTGTWVLALSVLFILCLASVVVLWTRWAPSAPLDIDPPLTPVATPQPVATPIPSVTLKPTPAPTIPPTPASSPTPALLGFDMSEQSFTLMKEDFLKRMELMPDLTNYQRSMIIKALTNSKGMKLLTRVSFETGNTEVNTVDLATIKQNLASPLIQQALQNPTLVFVVLGYSSKQGSAQLNLQLSQQRADTVLNTLQQQFQIKNVIYPIPMGASTLFSDKNYSENQVAEIWLLLP
jgi:outer membrane protein OmpA-like peptidoglycan-associated protein